MRHQMSSYYYTGIGSRDTPRDIQKVMRAIAYHLAKKGLTLRSGKAGGADKAFQLGVQRYVEVFNLDSVSSEPLADIYIPWQQFKTDSELLPWWDTYKQSQEAEEIAANIHPAWHKCSQGAKKMHTRNVFQVLGHWLPEVEASGFVIFYARETEGGKVSGGTATAVNLARDYNIPTINMYLNGWESKLESVLSNYES